MKDNLLNRFDYFLTLCVMVLCAFSVLFIYSAGINSEGNLTSTIYVRQIIWGSVGVVLMLLIAFFDYRKYARYVPYIYGISIFLLIFVLAMGILFPQTFIKKGARSWLGIGSFGIQPSEFCKISFIMFLAWFLERSAQMEEKKRTLIALGILALPAGLILIQPDFGTAMIYVPIFLFMCFVAGIPLRFLAFFVFTGICTALFVFLPLWQDLENKSYAFMALFTRDLFFYIELAAFSFTFIMSLIGYFLFPELKKIFYWIAYVSLIFLIAFAGAHIVPKFMHDYQLKRLIIFLDPDSDPLNAGWNIKNSKIAIGSGMLFGKGFMAGTQSHLQYLPEQSTDFIFSILAEEIGFVGAFGIFVIYLLILIRIIYILKNTLNTYGFYIGTGILALILFHFIVNVGMVMGIMPVTGVPLLFMSYGGSSLWTSMISIGLIMSIRYRKFDF